MTVTRSKALMALVGVDAAGAVIAVRGGVVGEPFGIGASLDVRRVAVVIFWGTGLSAPLASLAGALLVDRIWSRGLRTIGLLFAVGGLSEPVLWGRRPCPRHGRLLLALHIALATAMTVAPARGDSMRAKTDVLGTVMV